MSVLTVCGGRPASDTIVAAVEEEQEGTVSVVFWSIQDEDEDGKTGMTGSSWPDGKLGGMRIGRSERIRRDVASLSEVEAEARAASVSVVVGCWLFPPSTNA